MTGTTLPCCSAQKKDGSPCGAYTVPGEPYCPFHDPARAHSFHEGRRKGGRAPRRVRRLPVILDHMHVAELMSECLIHAVNHPDSFDPRRLQAVTSASRALLKAVGVPKDTHLHYHRGQPLPNSPHLLRVYAPLEPALSVLLGTDTKPEFAAAESESEGSRSEASEPEESEIEESRSHETDLEEPAFDPWEQCDPDEDPDVVQHTATAWPRRARLRPDSTLATPLACYDEHGCLDHFRLLRWHQEHPTPPAANNSPFPSREGGQGVRSAPAAAQDPDKCWTSLPGTQKNKAPAVPAPVSAPPSRESICNEDPSMDEEGVYPEDEYNRDDDVNAQDEDVNVQDDDTDEDTDCPTEEDDPELTPSSHRGSAMVFFPGLWP